MQLPRVIYRYINWSDKEAIKTITLRQLYFYTADKWKNYGEYEFGVDVPPSEVLKEEIESIVESLRNREKEVYERWFNLHVKLYGIDFSKYLTLPFPENELFEQQTVDKIIEYRIKEIQDRPEVYQRLIRKFYFQHTGILSTSMTEFSKSLWDWKSRFDSDPSNNVICVAIVLDCLKKKLDEVGNYSMGIVNYTGHKNKINLLASSGELLIKRYNSITHTLPVNIGKDIQDQQELRIVKVLTSDKSKNSPERFIELDKECIEKITIHKEANQRVKDELSLLAASNGWPIEVYLPDSPQSESLVFQNDKE